MTDKLYRVRSPQGTLLMIAPLSTIATVFRLAMPARARVVKETDCKLFRNNHAWLWTIDFIIVDEQPELSTNKFGKELTDILYGR